jgi:signal transduction histidine kinase
VENETDLRSFFRSDRPPIELGQFNNTYRRTRVSVNVLIALASLIMRGRFDYRPYVVTGIIVANLLIVGHAYLRRRAGLREMITWDTILYLSMTVLADLPEVAIFVAMAQSFIIFFFVPIRAALLTTGAFISAGLAAAVISIITQLQQRSTPETISIVVTVTLMTILTVAWTLATAAAEMYRHRDEEERLVREKDDLLADKDRFVASVSHELRTPLTAVVGLAHTLAEGEDTLSTDERNEFVGILVEQSEEVAAIVDDLLVAARAETGHLSLVVEEVDLRDQLAAALPCELSIEGTGARAPLVIGDPIRIRQILRNLISNAQRYGGGNIRVRLSSDPTMGRISIEDDGHPIPPEQRETIFSAYGRAHDRPGRTDSVGLGLTVSRQLARLMGGDVIYSHRDGWSTFALSLPLSMTAVAEALKADPQAAKLAHRLRETPAPQAPTRTGLVLSNAPHRPTGVRDS